MSRITGLHHVSLIVSDTARALEFYQGVLGLERDPSRPDLGFPGAWLSLGRRQLHLLEAGLNGVVPGVLAPHQAGVLVDTVGELAEVV